MDATGFEDKQIECKQCHKPFTLSAGEQQFFAERGLFQPSRCKACRAENREKKAADTGGQIQVQEVAQTPPTGRTRPIVVETRGGPAPRQGRRNPRRHSGDDRYED